ncbi:hypothetical protein D9M72_387380 [compost metagenome]
MVWNATFSITSMMSTILPELASIDCMVLTTRSTASLPRSARVAASVASPRASRALSAFWRTVLVSSSMLEAVSSSEAACCSVRCDRSALPLAICLLAEAIESAPPRTSPTMATRLACIRPSMPSMRAVSLRADSSASTSPPEASTLRSPPAIFSKRPIAVSSGWTIERRRRHATTVLKARPTASTHADSVNSLR